MSSARSSFRGAVAAPHPRPALVGLEQPARACAPTEGAPERSARLGIGAMLLSTLLFPLSDMLSKALAATYSGIEVTWMRYVVLVAVVAPAALCRPSLLRTSRPLVQVSRGLSSAAATSLALVGFMFLPVANATAIGFCAPLIVTGLAALVLNEVVGARRWLAAIVGFIGILIIVQPGAGSFQLATLLPLTSSLFSACTVIATRIGRNERAETTVLWSALVGLAVSSLAVMFCWTGIDLRTAGIGMVMGLLAAAATVLQVVAYRCAPASLIAPFSYMQILSAVGIGWVVFGTVPGPAMLAGSAVVVASGCSVALKGRVSRPRARSWSALRRELDRVQPARRRAA